MKNRSSKEKTKDNQNRVFLPCKPESGSLPIGKENRLNGLNLLSLLRIQFHSCISGIVLSWILVFLCCGFIYWTHRLTPKLFWSFKDSKEGEIFQPVPSILIDNDRVLSLPLTYKTSIGNDPVITMDTDSGIRGIALPLDKIIPREGNRVESFAVVWNLYVYKEGRFYNRLLNVFRNGELQFSSIYFISGIYPASVGNTVFVVNKFIQWEKNGCNYLFFGSFNDPCYVSVNNVTSVRLLHVEFKGVTKCSSRKCVNCI